jgi:SAM-dependent methyltransferase
VKVKGSLSTYEKFSAPVPPEFPSVWYRADHLSHFWFCWRILAFRKLLERQAIPVAEPLRAFDVGCGLGVVRQQIEGLTSWIVDGADLNEYALVNQLPSKGRTFLYDVRNERAELLGNYDIIMAFDVLEHLDDAAGFLKALYRHLKPGGWLVVNVPALMFLFSRYDSFQGHKRRYTRTNLRAKVEAAGFRSLEARYWGLSLVPIALVRKVVLSVEGNRDRAMKTGFEPPAAWINGMLKLLMQVEMALLASPPAGTSVMALFRKE